MTWILALENGGFVCALAFAAIGSALGTSAAGMAAIGAWKRCYINEEKPPFILIAFVSAPLSQTIYGMILMNAILGASVEVVPMVKLFCGVFGGIAMGASAWQQGRAGAMASDAMAETKKGLGNYIMVLGIIETVALFVMVFLMTALR